MFSKKDLQIQINSIHRRLSNLENETRMEITNKEPTVITPGYISYSFSVLLKDLMQPLMDHLGLEFESSKPITSIKIKKKNSKEIE